MTFPHRELLIGGALVALAYADRLACGLRRRVRAHLHAQPSAPRAAAHKSDRKRHAYCGYETACAAFCAGASHA